jgi:protein-L-isoaspartate(D-aspartate) O-methyltransferase
MHGARATLARLGIGNVVTRHGDGARGWPEAAPFDAILIAAATPVVPPALCEQLLRQGGRMVLPLGGDDVQELVRVERHGATWQQHELGAVRFVPMRGLVREERA